MEEFYREIYAVNGITDLQFPQHYPVSRLLGTRYFANFFFMLQIYKYSRINVGRL